LSSTGSPNSLVLKAPNSLSPESAWASAIDTAAENNGHEQPHGGPHPSGPRRAVSSHDTFSSNTHGDVIVR